MFTNLEAFLVLFRKTLPGSASAGRSALAKPQLIHIFVIPTKYQNALLEFELFFI